MLLGGKHWLFSMPWKGRSSQEVPANQKTMARGDQILSCFDGRGSSSLFFSHTPWAFCPVWPTFVGRPFIPGPLWALLRPPVPVQRLPFRCPCAGGQRTRSPKGKGEREGREGLWRCQLKRATAMFLFREPPPSCIQLPYLLRVEPTY